MIKHMIMIYRDYNGEGGDERIETQPLTMSHQSPLLFILIAMIYQDDNFRGLKVPRDDISN